MARCARRCAAYDPVSGRHDYPDGVMRAVRRRSQRRYQGLTYRTVGSRAGSCRACLLLAERDGMAVGYVSAVRQLHLWTGGDVLNLDDLYVRPGSHDAGVGRRLMAALAALTAPDHLLIRRGMEPDKVNAQRFYRRMGAMLRPKVLAAWPPTAYAEVAAGLVTRRATD